MKAAVGDRILIVPNRMDVPTRDGRIVEVRGERGAPPYLVEWGDTGHRGLLFPGPDARIQHFGDEPAEEPAQPPTRTRSWRVELQIVERGPETNAHAVLVTDESGMATDGIAHRNPRDADDPHIGDEVAAGRALKRLGEYLLAQATREISKAEGHRAKALT